MNSKIPFEVVNTQVESPDKTTNSCESTAPEVVCDSNANPTTAMVTSEPIVVQELPSTIGSQPMLFDEPSIDAMDTDVKDADNIQSEEDLESIVASSEPASSEPASSEPASSEPASSEPKPKKIKARKIKSVPVDEELAAIAAINQIPDAEEASDDMGFESSAFEELGLIPAVVSAIETAGYKIPTPIQMETIPAILAGKDLIGRAETGSGKTAAFACPLLSMLDMSVRAPQVLVLAPTRELAIQVTASFEKYGSEINGFRAVTIYGGQSYETQFNALRRGVQVVVGTPGRVMDHLRQKTLDLSSLKTIVLDEGDEMLRMGFLEDVEWILEQIPGERQALLFSATMPAPIQKIAQTHLRRPVTISIQNETATAECIKQSCVLVQPRTKLDMLTQVLESEETDGVIVFVKTRNSTLTVADHLNQRGFLAAPLNGEVAQNQREQTIQNLKLSRLNVLVATDVAARGLDVQRISHVINFDFPHDTEAYIHRIGRTGRAGREGAAILFVEPKEQGKLKRLQRETNQFIDKYRQKTLEQINAVRIQKFKERITESIANTAAQTSFVNIIDQYREETGSTLEQISVALAVMAQGDTPLLLKQTVNARSNFEPDREKGGKRYQGDMTTYRVEVGKAHGVGPGNIVGAIANEVGLEYASIGKIKLFDDFSTIELPSNISEKTLDDLKTIVVSGRKLQISLDRNSRSSYGRSSGGRSGGRSERGERTGGRGERSGGRGDRSSRNESRSPGEGSDRGATRRIREDRERPAQASSDRPASFRRPEGDTNGETSPARRPDTRGEFKRPKFDASKGKPARSGSPRSGAPKKDGLSLFANRSGKKPAAETTSEKRSEKPGRKFIKLRGN